MILLKRAVRFFAKALSSLLAFYLFVLGTHGLWLPWFGEFLIIKEPLKKADIVVVSTGSYPRFRYAIELMKAGYSQKLLLLSDERLKEDSNEKSLAEYAREEAIDEGFAGGNIFVGHSTGTQGDARETRKLMASLGFKSAIVISDSYNMRRLAMVFQKVFRGTSAELIFAHAHDDSESFPPPESWWKSYHTFSYVIKEWIKLPIDFYLLAGERDI